MTPAQPPTLLARQDFEDMLRRLDLPDALVPYVVAISDGGIYWKEGDFSPRESQVVLAALSMRRHPDWAATVSGRPALRALESAVAGVLSAALLTRPPVAVRPSDWIAQELATAVGEATLKDAWLRGDAKAIERILVWLEPSEQQEGQITGDAS